MELLRQEITEIKKTIELLDVKAKELFQDFKQKGKPAQHPYRDLSNLQNQLSHKNKEVEKWQSGSDRPFASPYYWSAFTLQGLR